MIVKLLIDGFLLGLLIAVSLGPAFFAIIQIGISKGFKFGVLFAMGVLLSDIVLVSISYLLGQRLFDDAENKALVGLIGGIILIIFGSVSWAKKPDILKRRSLPIHAPLKTPALWSYPIRGFFLNIANPFLYFFWFGALGIVGKLAPEGKLLESTLIFFSATFATTFSTDILKSYIGGKIKKFLNPRKEILINKIVGVVLLAFGVILIFRTLSDYGFFTYLREHF